MSGIDMRSTVSALQSEIEQLRQEKAEIEIRSKGHILTLMSEVTDLRNDIHAEEAKSKALETEKDKLLLEKARLETTITGLKLTLEKEQKDKNLLVEQMEFLKESIITQSKSSEEIFSDYLSELNNIVSKNVVDYMSKNILKYLSDDYYDVSMKEAIENVISNTFSEFGKTEHK